MIKMKFQQIRWFIHLGHFSETKSFLAIIGSHECVLYFGVLLFEMGTFWDPRICSCSVITFHNIFYCPRIRKSLERIEENPSVSEFFYLLSFHSSSTDSYHLSTLVLVTPGLGTFKVFLFSEASYTYLFLLKCSILLYKVSNYWYWEHRTRL